jgi:hypothetical protein
MPSSAAPKLTAEQLLEQAQDGTAILLDGDEVVRELRARYER